MRCLQLAGALIGAALLVIAAGCAAPSGGAEEQESGSVFVFETKTKTVCFGGRTFGDPMSIGGIPELDRLCRQMPEAVRDDARGRDASYFFFQWNSLLSHVIDQIVDALDTNGDGDVTDLDAPVNLMFVGYSWGGFNAIDAATLIASDRRFSPRRKAIARLFTLDAFRTDYGVVPRAELRVPANVRTFYSFRHTVGPQDECSSFLLGLVGPFTGRDPLCTGTTECHDYDFSALEATRTVDHCEVPRAATPAILDLTNGRVPNLLPPDRPVPRY